MATGTEATVSQPQFERVILSLAHVFAGGWDLGMSVIKHSMLGTLTRDAVFLVFAACDANGNGGLSLAEFGEWVASW